MLTPTQVYQRWLEYDRPPPAEGAGKTLPMHSWVVPLMDGRAMVTLLFRPLAARRHPPQTVVLEVSAEGEAVSWPPGQGYPAPVLFYANERDELFGLDLTKPGKVYVCLADGTHLHSLDIALRMETILAPTSLRQVGDQLFWTTPGHESWGGTLGAAGLVDIHLGSVLI